MTRMWKSCLVAAAALVVAAGAVRAGDPVDTTVYRYLGTKPGNAWGKQALLLVLEPPMGGTRTELIIPSKNGMGAYEASPVITDVTSKLKAGALVKVHAANMMGALAANYFTTYDAKPGEDTPRGFVFKKSEKVTVGKDEYLSLQVHKYGQDATVLLPAKKPAEGAPDFVAVAESLKAGQVIELETSRSGGAVVAQAVDIYQPPKAGTFDAVGEVEVDGAKRPAASVTINGESETLALAGTAAPGGKWTVNAALATFVKTLKKGQSVEMVLRERAGRKFIREIRLAAPATAGKP